MYLLMTEVLLNKTTFHWKIHINNWKCTTWWKKYKILLDCIKIHRLYKSRKVCKIDRATRNILFSFFNLFLPCQGRDWIHLSVGDEVCAGHFKALYISALSNSVQAVLPSALIWKQQVWLVLGESCSRFHWLHSLGLHTLMGCPGGREVHKLWESESVWADPALPLCTCSSEVKTIKIILEGTNENCTRSGHIKCNFWTKSPRIALWDGKAKTVLALQSLCSFWEQESTK